MPPLQPRDHRISLEDAAKHTRRHRETIQGKPREGDHCGAFHGDQVLAILKQKECVGLRIYHGRNEKGNRSLVLVGIDPRGNDMTQGLLCELCFPCPPDCSATNPLNS